ncbi:hypothetical protein [Gemmobacter serpentinus]|uniref:hypothetical protein n=1 Tax=Gemmobacter serpentinus TaxID=2652247 RepID=UPI00124DACAB|nr:hypothetical protein [Gemmobacter serpentinus]
MSEVLEDLGRVLARIRSAVLAGDFHLLAGLEEELEALRPDLRGMEPARLAPLLAQASANQRLLAAASRGVRAAQRRLAELARAMEGFQTYDAAGHLQPGGAKAIRLRRRI